jgi:hypothetical protein
MEHFRAPREHGRAALLEIEVAPVDLAEMRDQFGGDLTITADERDDMREQGLSGKPAR